MPVGSRDNLFDIVHSQLQGEPNRRGYYNADCPFCGKPAKPGQNHFGYRYDAQTGAGGYRCFVCGSHGSLANLADYLSLDTGSYTPIRRVAAPHAEPETEAQMRRRYRRRMVLRHVEATLIPLLIGVIAAAYVAYVWLGGAP